MCHSFSSKEETSFNFMAAVTVPSDFGTQENKICHCFHFPPSVCHEKMGPDAMIFPVAMYGSGSWTIKKAEHWRIDAFELWCWRRLLSPLDCKEIQRVHPKGNQSWIFIGRSDAEAEAPILRLHDAKNWLVRKDPDAGKDRRQGKGMSRDEMVGWHHQLERHEFEQAPGVDDGQGSLVCCSLCGSKSQTRLSNWTETKHAILQTLKLNFSFSCSCIFL